MPDRTMTRAEWRALSREYRVACHPTNMVDGILTNARTNIAAAAFHLGMARWYRQRGNPHWARVNLGLAVAARLTRR